MGLAGDLQGLYPYRYMLVYTGYPQVMRKISTAYQQLVHRQGGTLACQ